MVLRRVRIPLIWLLLALLLLGVACTAYAGDALDVDDRWSVGGELSAGAALTRAPDDPQGTPSLLNGTSFGGWTWRMAAQGAFQMSRCLRFRLEFGFSQATISGYAEEIDGVGSRDLEFRMSRLDIPLLVEFRPELGVVSPMLALGYGLRVQTAVRANEEIGGFVPDEPEPLALERSVSGVLHLQSGLVFALSETLRLLTTFRAAWNSTYPDTTSGRLSAGRYRAETDWELSGAVGVQVVIR